MRDKRSRQKTPSAQRGGESTWPGRSIWSTCGKNGLGGGKRERMGVKAAGLLQENQQNKGRQPGKKACGYKLNSPNPLAMN